jgi:hypothetical protein
VYLKKKKTARITTATAADPKADRIPMRMPLPVDPVELPLATRRSPCQSSEEIPFCRSSRISCRDGDGPAGVRVGWDDEDAKPIGDVAGMPITVLRVEGRSASAPGPDASEPCMVHLRGSQKRKDGQESQRRREGEGGRMKCERKVRVRVRRESEE